MGRDVPLVARLGGGSYEELLLEVESLRLLVRTSATGCLQCEKRREQTRIRVARSRERKKNASH